MIVFTLFFFVKKIQCNQNRLWYECIVWFSIKTDVIYIKINKMSSNKIILITAIMSIHFSLCLTSTNTWANMHLYIICKNLMSNWNVRSLILTCIACLSISNLSFCFERNQHWMHCIVYVVCVKCMHAFTENVRTYRHVTDTHASSRAYAYTFKSIVMRTFDCIVYIYKYNVSSWHTPHGIIAFLNRKWIQRTMVLCVAYIQL